MRKRGPASGPSSPARALEVGDIGHRRRAARAATSLSRTATGNAPPPVPKAPGCARPQARPTAKASSSDTPNSSHPGAPSPNLHASTTTPSRRTTRDRAFHLARARHQPGADRPRRRAPGSTTVARTAPLPAAVPVQRQLRHPFQTVRHARPPPQTLARPQTHRKSPFILADTTPGEPEGMGGRPPARSQTRDSGPSDLKETRRSRLLWSGLRQHR